MIAQIDDIIAALFLSLIMYRRLEVLTVQAADNPHVPEARLQEWREMALQGYKVGAIACVAKVILNQIWFRVVSQGEPSFGLSVGGFLIFGGWVVGLVWAWRRITEANAIRTELGIQRRQPPQKPAA
jgi:hypothetical protein